jgi:hypothetical protein
MDIKDLLLISTPAGTLAGVLIGWALNQRSSRRTRLSELKIENYAEWAAGMETSLANYVAQKGVNPYRTPLCEKRLLLIETDPIALKLIQEVRDAIPGVQSDDFKDLMEDAQLDPEQEWPPFRKKMDQLFEHLRRHP